MGLCLGTEDPEEEKKARIRSSKIDRDLYEYAKQEMNVVKILILGAAESGKSTLVKQMKIIHSNGFTKQELSSFKPAVLDNLLTSMKFVLHGMGILRINLANSRNKVHAHSVLSCGRCFDEDQVVFPFLSHALFCLWADHGVRAAAARGYEYELNDSALYFFDNMSRITSPDYVPTETDVLRVRLRTTGVIETQFKVSHLIFRMYDVGGQRTERRKWISCFEDVRAVLFVVSLSGYDMTLVEDPSVNRLQESLKLFSSICNNVFFRSTSMSALSPPPRSSPPGPARVVLFVLLRISLTGWMRAAQTEDVLQCRTLIINQVALIKLMTVLQWLLTGVGYIRGHTTSPDPFRSGAVV